MNLSARTDRRLIRPTHRSTRFVLAEITAPEAFRFDGRPPVNLAFILDRSGSMSGEKIRLAKQAIDASLARLNENDEFAIVVYDDQIDVVVPRSPATAEARRNALARLREIEARGSTNLGGGWLRGAEQIADALRFDGVNRCLLLTDGLANVGIVDHGELARHAYELRARGISTTTFGVGNDFDEKLLQAMASAGGGHFYYIADAGSIADYVTSEVGEALDIVAREVTLEVTAPEGMGVEALSPYPTNPRPGRTEIVIGDLTAQEQLEVVVRLTFPYGEIGRGTGALFALADRDGVLDSSAVKLSWDYADDKANDVQDRDRSVDRAVARVFAARARQEAVERNRAGDFDGARNLLVATARRIRGYAGRDVELGIIAADLEHETEVVAAPMMVQELKEMFTASSYVMRSRMPDGKAMKTKGPVQPSAKT